MKALGSNELVQWLEQKNKLTCQETKYSACQAAPVLLTQRPGSKHHPVGSKGE